MTIKLFLFLFFAVFKINESISDTSSVSKLINYDEQDFEVIKYSDYIITIYSEVEAKPCFYFCKLNTDEFVIF
jgi:hypothetical protein